MTTKLVLTWLSVCPAAESTSKFKKMAYKSFTVANYVAHLSGFLTYLVYLLKYSSTDLEGSIFAFMAITTYVGMVYITASLSLQRDQISEIFRKLSTIYELRKYRFFWGVWMNLILKFTLKKIMKFHSTEFHLNRSKCRRIRISNTGHKYKRMDVGHSN